MGMLISEGVNGGYPYIEGLPELDGIAMFCEPYPQYFFRFDSSRNNGYPVMHGLHEMDDITGFKPLYPEYMMQCYGEDVCGGYPCILNLTGAVWEIYSRLKFADKDITGLYYNGEFISHAFCNDEEVFAVRYSAGNK